MTYTVHITVPTGPWPGGATTAPWDDLIYDDPTAAMEVARDAYSSRDRRRDVFVVDQDGRTWDWFKAEPAPTHPLIGDDRPVHFTRTEVQQMIARLGRLALTDEVVAEVHDALLDRLADTDRMLDAWNGIEEIER